LSISASLHSSIFSPRHANSRLQDTRYYDSRHARFGHAKAVELQCFTDLIVLAGMLWPGVCTPQAMIHTPTRLDFSLSRVRSRSKQGTEPALPECSPISSILHQDFRILCWPFKPEKWSLANVKQKQYLAWTTGDIAQPLHHARGSKSRAFLDNLSRRRGLHKRVKSAMSCVHLRQTIHRFTPYMSHRKVLLWVAFSTCFVVFLINLALVLLAYTHLSKDSPDNYVRSLYSGDCNQVKRAGTGAHLVINILSTLMLWASNLALQLIGAPTRKAIDAAHKKGTWLDVGIVSLRNLSSIPKMNLLVWIILASSSLPIHFL